jgi:serine/threonine-protein kinase
MLDEDGRVVLTDFGISKAVQGTTHLTGTGTVIGTPQYMAPEQAKGREVDGRADQYALGMVGYRALTGELPFEGDPQSILYQQVHEPPPSVLERRPDTPLDLRVALERALAKDSKWRFPSMEEFAASVSGERAASPHSGTTTLVSTPPKPGAQAKTEDPQGSGVYVAWGTLAVVILAALIGIPRMRTSSTIKPPAAAQSAPRRPVATMSPPSVKKSVAPKARVQEYASLSVRSSPSGVLYLDGVRIGLTPITNRRLAPGTHRLRIDRKGYRTVTETIVVKSTRPILRRYDLRRQAGR